jgi:hypothetical protein
VLSGARRPTATKCAGQLQASGTERDRPLPGSASVPAGLLGLHLALGLFYDDTAVNTGYYSFSYVKDGEPETLPARYSFTFVPAPCCVNDP